MLYNIFSMWKWGASYNFMWAEVNTCSILCHQASKLDSVMYILFTSWRKDWNLTSAVAATISIQGCIYRGPVLLTLTS